MEMCLISDYFFLMEISSNISGPQGKNKNDKVQDIIPLNE